MSDPSARVFAYPFSSIYGLYVAKVTKKGRTQAELDEVLRWFTGLDAAALAGHVAAGSSLEQLFAAATLPPGAALVTGVVCGVRVEAVEDPLMRKIRAMDKLVDELAKGKKLETVLRA